MNYFITAITKKYADFNGRATRAEFWFFQLFNFLVALALIALIGILFIFKISFLAGFLIGIYILLALFFIIPSLAVAVRRLHDVGQSGWMILIDLIPFFGAIILLIFYLLDSEDKTNEWGPNPKRKLEK